jgi:hypothetical protein
MAAHSFEPVNDRSTRGIEEQAGRHSEHRRANERKPAQLSTFMPVNTALRPPPVVSQKRHFCVGGMKSPTRTSAGRAKSGVKSMKFRE